MVGWVTLFVLGYTSSIHLYTHDHYISDWPAATLIGNVTAKLFTVVFRFVCVAKSQ